MLLKAEASSAGRRQLNYALVRGGGVRKISTSIRAALRLFFSSTINHSGSASPKRENPEQSRRRDHDECSISATKPLNSRFGTNPVGTSYDLYAASFVIRECATSLVCDPTIFISCQS